MKIPQKCEIPECSKVAVRWFLESEPRQGVLHARCDQHARTFLLLTGMEGRWSKKFVEKTRDELLIMEIHDA